MKNDIRLNFAEWLFAINKSRSEKVAVIDTTSSITYGNLELYARRYATHLVYQGLLPSDRVVIYLDDCVEWPIIFLGCLLLGANPVIVSGNFSKNTVDSVVNITKAKLTISTTDNVYSNNSELTKSYKFYPTESCLWLLSSGTTSNPKCIVHQHQNFFLILEKFLPDYKFNESNRIFSTAKLSFIYGLNNSITVGLGIGATIFLMPGPPAPSRIFNALTTHKITHFFTVPSVLNSMVKYKKHNSLSETITTIVSAGEALSLVLAAQFETKFNKKILNSIGMSELMYNYCTQTPTNSNHVSLGKPLPGISCKICDSDGTVVEPGKIGELYVKHPGVALYYWPNQTSLTDASGWFKTNDLVLQDQAGDYLFIARSDDLIKVNGLLISPVEIEEQLLLINEISECAVVAKTSISGLNEIHAYIATNKQISNTELNIILKKRLAPYKIPKQYHRVESIPKTVTNKVKRKQLRQS